MVENGNVEDMKSIVEHIQVLKLDSNWDMNAKNLTDDDARILAMELQSNKHCHVLHLHLNHITDDGMIYLAEMLKTNSTLTDLYLGANNIGNRGVKVLCEALTQHNRTLVVIDLTCNGISDEAVNEIADLCKVNDTLMGFMLTSNPITEEGKNKLRTISTFRKMSFGADF